MQDLRFAFRSLRRRPGGTLVLVLTAGVAIGAATATFDLANLVSWRPLPSAEFWIYLAVASVLLSAGLAATFLPGRRASRLDPTEVLRRD